MKKIHLLLLAILSGCGADDEEPQPLPIPAKTRIEVLREGGRARISLTVDGVGGPVFLRGQRGSLFYGQGQTHIADIDTVNCTVTAWWRSQDEYLDAAQRNRVNLLHVELWNVWESQSPFPFLKDGSGRFRVQAAVEGSQWNPEYFSAVRHLVEGASARGIVVVFSLFNHYNVRTEDTRHQGKPWAAEPLRAANSDTGLGLDDYAGDHRLRMASFARFQNQDGSLTPIARVQKALIERLLEEVREENVIFELLMAPWMVNQAGYLDALGLARWENWAIGQIRAKEQSLGRARGVQVMVTPATLNSFALRLDGQINNDFEIAAWKSAFQKGTAGYENWREVGLLDYAGFFAFDDPPFPEQARVMMEQRMAAHAQLFPETVALYNTDGFNQRYAPNRCSASIDPYVQDVRHGWWNDRVQDVDLSIFPLRWAERTQALHSTQPLGTVHFLNWSTSRPSLEDLARGPW